MDIILLRSLKVQTVIGTLAWERKVPQILQVTLEIATDTRRVAVEDALTKTVDYTHIAQTVRQFGQENTFQLIETFAEQLAEYLKKQFQISWIKIQVLKPKAIPEAEAVGVIIERAW